MDDIREAALITGCQQAVMRFYSALDRSDYETLAALMAPDGVWHRQGKVLRGPREVLAALKERPAGRVTAHLVQNLVVELHDDARATARYMTLVYRHDGDAGAAKAPLGPPLSIASATDQLRREDRAWLVVEKRSRRVFGGP